MRSSFGSCAARASALFLLVAAIPRAHAVSDVLQIPTGTPATPGTTVAINLTARDLSTTALGRDQPAGNRIQSLALRVDFSPPGVVVNASIAKAGITAALTSQFESSTFSAGHVVYVASYDESTNLIPFTLDAAAPGDVLARLDVTLAPNAPAGTLLIGWNAVTELDNLAGTIAENTGNGQLSLVNGDATVLDNRARGLFAAAQSTSAIRLTWVDPQLNETGFRIERSTDGTTWTPAGSVGPNTTSFDDTSLAAGTLFYYRVIAFNAAGDALPSNRATASTFPASAAKVCADEAVVTRRFARGPSVAWNGTSWALAWSSQESARQQIFFERLDGSTLAPIGTAVNVSNTGYASFIPTLRWNGSTYGVVWTELAQRGASGTLNATSIMYSEIDASGNVLRRAVPIAQPPPVAGFTGLNEVTPLEWDGTHWGVFTNTQLPPLTTTVDYRRLTPQGTVVTGPVSIAAEANAYLFDVAAAWHPTLSEHGVLWIRQKDDLYQLQFQAVDEANGAVLLGAPALVASVSAGSDLDGTSLVVDPAGGWLAAWGQCDPNECAIFTRRITSAGVPDVGGPVRVSAPATGDIRPTLVRRAGGYAVVFETSSPTNFAEVARFLLDANGAPIGASSTLSTIDSRHSARPRAASDGARVLAAWSEAATTLEVAGALSDDTSVGPVVAFTSGHDVGNTASILVPSSPRVVPVGAGFASVWVEPQSGAALAHGRLYRGDGSIAASFAPFSTTTVNNRVGLASVGSTFALAWRTPIDNTLRFARYDGNGAVLTAETTAATSTASGAVELGWDGEAYTAIWPQGSSFRMQRIAESGAPIGTGTLLASGGFSPTNLFRMAWMGDGWAVVWRSNVDGAFHYARYDSNGATLLAPVALTNVGEGAANDMSLRYTGDYLGASWTEMHGVADPPGVDVYFTVLNRNGTKAFPQTKILGSPLFDVGQLYFANGKFHFVYASDVSDVVAGMKEIDIDPNGTLTGTSRFLANHGSTVLDLAHNGATLAMAWRVSPVQDIFVETDACLADATPPPCPTLALSSLNNNVRASWSAVSDAESGLWRYNLYRDGKLLNEFPPSQLVYDDGGYGIGVTHGYQVRAMNRAFQESASCPTKLFSTTAGDANGNGVADVADIFYLINFLLGGGPPPLGDGDANGDGIVTPSDIFYLINYFFGSGPPPAAIVTGAMPKMLATVGIAASTGRATESEGVDLLLVDTVAAAPGATASVPIRWRTGGAKRLEALSLRVEAFPRGAVSAIRVVRSGAAAGVATRFEAAPVASDGASYLALFDPRGAPRARRTGSTEIARIQVTLAAGVAAGTRIELRLDPVATMIGNASGTSAASATDDSLLLRDGAVDVR